MRVFLRLRRCRRSLDKARGRAAGGVAARARRRARPPQARRALPPGARAGARRSSRSAERPTGAARRSPSSASASANRAHAGARRERPQAARARLRARTRQVALRCDALLTFLYTNRVHLLIELLTLPFSTLLHGLHVTTYSLTHTVHSCFY